MKTDYMWTYLVDIEMFNRFCLQVKELIVTESFKFNCGVVCLDFMIRHGIITPDEGKLKNKVIKSFLSSENTFRPKRINNMFHRHFFRK